MGSPIGPPGYGCMKIAWKIQDPRDGFSRGYSLGIPTLEMTCNSHTLTLCGAVNYIAPVTNRQIEAVMDDIEI